MIYYFTPFDTNRNLADQYNAYMNLLNDDDVAVFTDGDTIFLTPDYGEIIEKVIASNENFGAYTCKTNRIGCKWQIDINAPKGDDIKKHREYALKVKEEGRYSFTPIKKDADAWSGFFMVIRKSAWNKIEPLTKKGMLGVDNEIYFKMRKAYIPIGMINGLYVYHYYRGGNVNDTSHLTQFAALNDSNDKVVYTALFGHYEMPTEVEKKDKGWDYVMFTDDPYLKNKVKTWHVIYLPIEEGLSPVKMQRKIKIMPHVYLKKLEGIRKKYNVSVWVDANIAVRGGLNEYLKSSSVFQSPKHEMRDCIYDEMYACLRLKKDTLENMQPQIERYREEGFPRHYGLIEDNIIVRRHNDERCVKIDEAWWNEVENGSHRDQLSLYYALWKTGMKDEVLQLNEKTKYGRHFAIHAHNKQHNGTFKF